MVGTHRRLSMACLAFAISLLASPLRASEVTQADLRAIVNAIGFLDGLPRGDSIEVAIVSGSDVRSARQTAATLEKIPGPGQSSLTTTVVSISDLARVPTKTNLLLLMPDALDRAAEISEMARSRRLVTIGTDPACLETSCCTLMVQAAGHVKIVLDTKSASAVGARFSSVFTMMVERR